MNKTAIFSTIIAVTIVAGIFASQQIEAVKPPQESDSDIIKRQFIQTVASQDGAIQVNGFGGAVLYYGDTLCEILTINPGTGVVIHFAMETTVLHMTDCVNQGTGQLFSLEGSLDATFQTGDLLAVEQNFDDPPKLVEVHREQTIL